MAGVNFDPAAAAQRWASGMAASGPRIQAGVQAVQTSPGILAAAQKANWLAAINASADRWANSLSNMPLAYWQGQTINKGIPRVTGSTTLATPKVQAFLTSWKAYEQQVVAALPPRGNIQQNIQRAVQLIEANAKAKGQFRQQGRSR